MQILLASAEVTPFAKAGGLADVAGALPSEWHKFGQNPIVIMPKYSSIDVEKYGFKPTGIVLYVPISIWTEYAALWVGKLPDSNVPVYLIQNDDYFKRDGIYGDPVEYLDNDRRFIFFSRAVFEAAKALNFKPDILHAHDFHPAFTMAFLKSHYKNDYHFINTAGVYTIHNLAYQGQFNPARAMEFAGFGMSQFYPGSWFEKNGSVNAMKTGIMFADKITTVSPTYAKEIRYPYFSEGLQDTLNMRGGDLVGILNGGYYEDWNPKTDKYIYKNYDSSNFKFKLDNKKQFLSDYAPNQTDGLQKPLVGMVTRLTEQKGIDLLTNILEWYISNDVFSFALVGTGERRYQDYFNYLAGKYPGKAIVYIGYNEELSHRTIAACDYLLMPSRFEPCGLTQMYAMKYGTIPIVRTTGGLADSVIEYQPQTAKGNGFTFLHYNADDFAYALRRAISIYDEKPHWDLIRKNAMEEDFSSSRSALEYLKVFKWAMEKVKGI